MYDELVKALRFCEAHATCSECVLCPRDAKDMRCSNLLTNAADAIEELSAVNERQLLEIAVLSKPRWIPVTERLPEKEDMVIFHYAWTGMSGTVYKEVTLATLAELEHIGSKPLAWMQLPEPPKEE